MNIENAYLVHLIRAKFLKWILLKQIFDNKYIFCFVYLFPMFWFLIRQSFLQVPLINSEVLHPAVWNHTNIRFLNWHLWSISTNIKCRIYFHDVCFQTLRKFNCLFICPHIVANEKDNVFGVYLIIVINIAHAVKRVDVNAVGSS